MWSWLGCVRKEAQAQETGREEGEAVLGWPPHRRTQAWRRRVNCGLRLAHCEQQREAGGTEAHIPPRAPMRPRR